jgi:hypothetical protein
MTKKEMIIRTMCDFPNLNKWQIADRVGCHPTYVNQVENQWLKDTTKDERQTEMFEENTSAIDAILTERGSRYGPFITHAEITQRYKRLTHKFLHNSGKELDHDQQEALDMIFHKIGRIVNGDPDYIDSWDDIAGYAKLVADRLRGDVK